MAIASKITAVTAVVDIFKRREFEDYSAAAKNYKVDKTTISKNIRGVIPW